MAYIEHMCILLTVLEKPKDKREHLETLLHYPMVKAGRARTHSRTRDGKKEREGKREGKEGTKEKSKRQSRRKANRAYKTLLSYETLQFCFEGESARDGLQCCTSSGPMKACEM